MGADHHYVPQFRLRKWANADGELRTWKRNPFTGELTARMRSIASVGYKPDLYTLQHVPEEHSQTVENDVFANFIETNAAVTIDKILASGVGSLNETDRLSWAVYLNASHIRLPHYVAKLRESAKQHAEASFSDEKSQEEFRKIIKGASNSTLYEFVKQKFPPLLANFHLEIMIKIIVKPEIIDRFMGLTWYVRDVSSARNRLILGDGGLMMAGSFWKGPVLVAVPLDPTVLFAATDSKDYLARLKGFPDSVIVNNANVGTLSLCREFAFGDAEPSFVNKHFCAGNSE